MIRNCNKIWPALIVFTLLTIVGCGVKNSTGKKKMALPNLGLSMTIPARWTLDNPQMCHRGESNTGMLMDEPLEGKKFVDAVTQMSKEFGSEIITESKLKIGSYEAIRVHLKTPAGVHALRLYIHHGDKIISVSFAIESKELFTKYEPALLKSIETIKIK